MRRLLFAFLCVVSFLHAGPARAEQPSKGENAVVTSDSIVYKENSGVLQALGNAHILFGKFDLAGDSCVVDGATHEGLMDGNVSFKMPGVDIKAKMMEFNLDTGLGTLTGAKGSFGDSLFFTAGKIERTGPDSFKIYDGVLTSCPPDQQEWLFKAKSLNVKMEELAFFKDVSLRFYDTPVFYAPYWFAPAVTKRASGFLMPNIGSSSTNGTFIDNSYFWAISDQTDATFYLDYMTQRGAREGLEYRYALAERTHGQMNADYISDNLFRDNLWSFKYNHAQELTSSVDLMLNADMESKISYSKEFSPDTYTRTKPYTDSNATVSADSGPWYMSLTGRDNRGIDQVSTEELSKQPEVKLAFLPHAFYNTPLWLSGDAVGTSFYSTALPGASTLNRVDVSPTISTPFNLTRFFNVTPYVGGHQTYYDNNTKNTGPVSTSYYTTGLGIEGPRIFKIFKAKSDSYKHTITPKLDYVYIPGYEVDGTDRLKAVQMDGEDNSSPQSVLSFTLLNRVFSKKRGDEIFWLSLQQGYDFNQVPGAGTGTSVASSTVGTPTTPGPYVPLQFQLRSKPVGYFIFNMDMAFNHYLGIPDTMSQELGFAAPESAFYLSLDRSYSRQTLSVSPTGISTYFTQATTFDSGLLGFRISSKYSAEASAIYDEILQTYAGTMFALKFNSCCWGATLNAGTHPTTILNSNGTLSQTTETKFSFSINLKGIGDIGEKATPLLARKL